MRAARKTTKGGARKRPCPVHALAVEAGEIIAAMRLVEKRELAEQSTPLDDMHKTDMQDRLDAIQIEASYREPQSHDGAAFQLAVAGAIHDLLISSTFHSEHQREVLERCCARLFEAAREYLTVLSTKEGGKPAWIGWLPAAEYFCGAPIRRVAGIVTASKANGGL